MCLAIPAEITKIDGTVARVSVMGIETSVYVGLIEAPEAGDYVLIHVGCAIEKIQKEYVNYLEEQYKTIFDWDEKND